MTAMTAFPLGETSAMSVAEQSAFKTAASTGFKRLLYYNAPFSKTQALQAENVLGGGVNNAVDERAPGPGLVAVTGKIEASMQLAELGWYLKAALGYGASTGADPDYSHPFTSGADTLPVYTIEQMRKTGLFDVAWGCYLKTLALSMKSGQAGHAHVSADFGGRDILQNQAASIAGTPTAFADDLIVGAWQGVLNVGGVAVGKLIDMTATLTNTFQEDRYTDDPALSAVGLTKQGFMIDATVRYDTDALRASGVVDATTALPTIDTGVSLTWTKSAARKLTITPAAVRFEPMDAPIEGPGALQVKLKGRCEQTATDPMLTVALLSAEPSY